MVSIRFNGLPFLRCQVHDIVLPTIHQEPHTKIVLVRQHETLENLHTKFEPIR